MGEPQSDKRRTANVRMPARRMMQTAIATAVGGTLSPNIIVPALSAPFADVWCSLSNAKQ